MIEKNVAHLIDKQSLTIGNDFYLIVSDLLFFANYSELHRVLDRKGKLRSYGLIRDLTLFSRGSKIYDQIRIINLSGEEAVRINFSKDMVPVNVPVDKLQNKARRYYFTDSIKLNKGEIFVSPLDLNIEHGVLEKPVKPMIRFATPIFDHSGSKRGVLIFNYLAYYLLNSIKEMSVNEPGYTMLLNSEGYWLIGATQKDEWGFMYPSGSKQTMEYRHPEIWKRLTSRQDGQFYKDDGSLVTFNTIYPLIEGWKSSSGSGIAFEPSIKGKQAREYFWKLVSYVPGTEMAAELNRTYINYIILSLIFSLLLGGATWFAIRWEHLHYALVEKTKLLREIHHRVRNNLQIILSMINMQSSIRNSNEVTVQFDRLKNRLVTLSIAHDALYQNKNISQIDIEKYIQAIIKNVLNTNSPGQINCHVAVDDITLGINELIPCGLIINELIDNAYKHAFPGTRSGDVFITVTKGKRGQISMQVRDTGRGLPDEIDFRNTETFGYQLIVSLTEQINGTITTEQHDGFAVNINF